MKCSEMEGVFFRGLRTDRSGWVFSKSIDQCKDGRTYLKLYANQEGKGHWFAWIEVIPSTVSQGIGARDCDDREVYQGDIIDHNLKGFKLIVDKRGGSFVLSGPDYDKPILGVTIQGRVCGNIYQP